MPSKYIDITLTVCYDKMVLNSLKDRTSYIRGLTEQADQLHQDNVPAHSVALEQASLQSISSPRSVSPSTAQIWLPATCGFSHS